MKTVLIGCGAISRNHVPALKRLAPRVQLCAVCDREEEKAKKLLEETELSLPVYTDYREMFEKERPDAVHICTPHHLHAPMAIEALSRGIHVFMEKPACIDDAQLEALKQAEEASDATLCICFQNRFLPSVQKAKEWIDSGKMGRILGGRGFVTWDRGGAYYSESPWRGKKVTEGGSVLMNQSIHTLDLLLSFLGEPTYVQGAVGNYRNTDNDTEDTAHIHMTFPEGRVGIFYATNTFIRSRRVEWELVCENGILRFVGDKLFLDDEVVVDSRPDGPATGKAVWGKGHALIIDAFYRALEENGPPPVSLESASRSLRTIWSLYEKNGVMLGR